MNDYELAKKLQQELDDEELAKKLQAQGNSRPNPLFQKPETTISRVVNMVNDSKAKTLCDKAGLSIMNVSWEDSARWKNSSWGPCISDMTLEVEGHALPIIRHPNFTDLTWDVPIEQIPLVVGNEVGDVLYTVTLKEYLKDFRSFLSKPSEWKGHKNTLLASRDKHAIMSAQACFLPSIKKLICSNSEVEHGQETSFNVALYNYQSTRDSPAVLAIVATSKGTSAQVITNAGSYHGQKLYFNKKGQKARFIGQRLSDKRKEEGKETTGPMTQGEKQDNVLLIIQVPLKQKYIAHHHMYEEGDALLESSSKLAFESAPVYRSKKSNVEDAIIKVGEAEGKFHEIENLEIERDEQYPIRVTLQFYKSTDNGIVSAEDIATISKQLDDAKKKGVYIGSLVVAPNVGRPTEHHDHPNPPLIVAPAWWHNWWLIYKDVFPQYSEDQAQGKIKSALGSKFSNGSQSELQDKLLQILGGGPSAPAPVTWNIL